MVLFLVYMLVPLVVMGGAAFNASKLPHGLSVGGLHRSLVRRLWNDEAHVDRLPQHDPGRGRRGRHCGADRHGGGDPDQSISGRVRSVLYGLMVAPILTPGAVIGISTLLFWNKFSVPAGLHLSVLGQVSLYRRPSSCCWCWRGCKASTRASRRRRSISAPATRR